MNALDVTSPQQPAIERPRPLVWLQVLAQRGRLDRRLADGTSPVDDPRLAMRARQLVAPAARARLARSLHDAVRSVDESPFARLHRSTVPVDAPAVRTCDVELRALANALNEPHARAGGVVMARELLTNTAGPLYPGGTAAELRRRIGIARSAL